TGEIARRSPKNVSIARGIYDGPGGFAESDKSIEAHLAKIESEAAGALKHMGSTRSSGVPPEVWPFLPCQGARTTGWMKLEQQWVNQQWDGEVVEPPPDGMNNIEDRQRLLRFENPETGEVRYSDDKSEQEELRRVGWMLKLGRDDHLELLHMQ